MSTLQISLAVIGAVLLALIVAYNAWTARRNAPKKALPPQDEHAAALAQRQEPAFDPDAGVNGMAAAPPPLHDGDGITEPLPPGVDASDVRDLPLPAPHTGIERRGGLDLLIDAIAPLHSDQPVLGEVALAALPTTRRVGSKPFAVEGFNEVEQQWERPVPQQTYQYFQAGVQLANRTGALNEIEFSEFVVKTQAFADAINAAPDFPDMLHEVARARELDQFASEHDAQLAFVLRARQAAWSPGYLQQNALRLGFVPGPMPGRMLLPVSTTGLPPVLSLSFDANAAVAEDLDQSAVRDVLLSLDVAQVHRSEQPFARLREVATELCARMDGVLCDQNGAPLPAMAMDPIAGDLEVLYDQLDSRELSAGSLLARRLFS